MCRTPSIVTKIEIHQVNEAETCRKEDGVMVKPTEKFPGQWSGSRSLLQHPHVILGESFKKHFHRWTVIVYSLFSGWLTLFPMVWFTEQLGTCNCIISNLEQCLNLLNVIYCYLKMRLRLCEIWHINLLALFYLIVPASSFSTCVSYMIIECN